MSAAPALMRRVLPVKPTREDFQRVIEAMLDLPQVDLPLKHRFAPGIYMREIEMPADTFIIGAEHRTQHFNVVLSGRAYVMMDGSIEEVVAPKTFVSSPGVRKVLYIVETMRWQTIHANPENETDIERLEDRIGNFSPVERHHLRTKPRPNEVIEHFAKPKEEIAYHET